ncbi:MAG: hypothetical protein ACREYE_06255 [Gammaproteobacteria bacterium]
MKLLKIGAVVLRNTRRVRLLLSGSYPNPHLFFKVYWMPAFAGMTESCFESHQVWACTDVRFYAPG